MDLEYTTKPVHFAASFYKSMVLGENSNPIEGKLWEDQILKKTLGSEIPPFRKFH